MLSRVAPVSLMWEAETGHEKGPWSGKPARLPWMPRTGAGKKHWQGPRR